MTEILSDKAAYELAIGLAASQRIILEALFQSGTLEREEVVRAFHAQAEKLIREDQMVDAANVLRLIHRKIDPNRPGE